MNANDFGLDYLNCHGGYCVPYDLNINVDGLEQENSNSSALAVEYLQSAPSFRYMGSRDITPERLDWFTSLLLLIFHAIFLSTR